MPCSLSAVPITSALCGFTPMISFSKLQSFHRYSADLIGKFSVIKSIQSHLPKNLQNQYSNKRLDHNGAENNVCSFIFPLSAVILFATKFVNKSNRFIGLSAFLLMIRLNIIYLQRCFSYHCILRDKHIQGYQHLQISYKIMLHYNKSSSSTPFFLRISL